jgi:tight adherence protein C
MNDAHLVLMLALASLLPVCGVPLLIGHLRRAEMVAARLRAITAGAAQAQHGLWRAAGLLYVVAAFGGLLVRSGLLPRKTLNEAGLMLAGANLRGETVHAAFIGGKVLLLVGLPALGRVLGGAAGLTGHLSLVAPAAGAILALMLPDMLLGQRRRRRLAAIERGLPDALDLLVICVDAGLAFEPALERVTREIAPVHPEVAEEFALTVAELRIAADRRTVLIDLGARLDVDFLRRLASTLAQSMQIGAPLSRSLHMLAQELRQEQMTRFEARAARLPVMLTLPMVVFILPTVLMVVAGPAAVQLLRMH